MEQLGVELAEDSPPPKKWAGMAEHMHVCRAHVGSLRGSAPVLEGYQAALEHCDSAGIDAEDALRSLSQTLEAGLEPVSAACPRCGEAVLDMGARAITPATSHPCWACSYRVATPAKAICNPLADLLPRVKIVGNAWGICLGVRVGFLGAVGGSSTAAATAATSAEERAAAATMPHTCRACKRGVGDDGLEC